MITRQKAYQLRELIVKASESLTDEDALGGMELFDEWQPDTEYEKDKRVRRNGKLYRVEQKHTSQAQYPPEIVPALYTEIARPGEIPVWRQPTGAQDAYDKGDPVWYPDIGDDIWISNCNDNVWVPGVYGWDKKEGGDT